MLYHRYREKMKKVAAFCARLYAHKVLVIVGLVVFVAILAGLLAVKGTILFESNCPEEVEYGDKLGYRVYPVLSIARYEYSTESGGSWSREAPILPGQYRVRAVARTLTGQSVYTEEHSFTIVPRTITVSVAERTIDYGEAPSAKANLAKGDVLRCDIRYASRSDPNTEVWVDRASISITTKDGEDRTFCYHIEQTPHTSLRIKQRKLKITVSDASKVFDDIRLSYDAYEVTSGTLLEGDSLVAVFSAYIIEAGTVVNRPDLRIYNSTGEEVTAFYNLDIRSGKLTVEKRPLILRSGSRSYIYDGTGHEYTENYSIDASTPLVSGHRLEVTGGTRIIDVGKADNVLSVTIRNARGQDRTDSYSLFVEAGTVSVTPRVVTVHTPTESLVYNGRAQSATDVVVENGVGDTVRAVSPATQTYVGSTENRMSVTFHRDGKDVTGNYEISYVYGTLSVEKRRVIVNLTNTTREYDGTPLTSTAYTCDTSIGYPVADVDRLTLKTDGSVTRVGSVRNRYVEGSLDIVDKNGQSVLSNYIVTVNDGTLTVIPRNITITTGSRSWVYDGTTKTHHAYEITRGSLVAGHTASVTIVTECLNVGVYQNLAVSSSTRIHAAGGEDVTDQYNITHAYGRLQITGHPITVHTESGEWMYDGEPHATEKGADVWLDAGTPLLDGHTIEFSGGISVIHVGTKPNVYKAYIYNEQGEDMTSNYEITYASGKLTIHPRPITVYTGDGERIYNGRSEVAGEPSLSNSPYALVKGDTLHIGSWDTDSFCDVGAYENVYQVAVMNRNGEDVTTNYEITYEYGLLQVNYREVMLEVNITKVYNGLGFDRVGVATVGGTTLASGHQATAYITGGGGTDVGTYDVGVQIIISDGKGRNVTHNYIFDCDSGVVTVTPRHITVSTADATKIYDGKPLIAREVTTTEDSLPLGWKHTIEVTVTGEGTEVGIYPNTADYESLRILDEAGVDVTANYVIDAMLEGLLIIRHDTTITVSTGSASKAYDGLPLRENGYKIDVTSGELPAGYTVDVRVTGAITMPGSVDNTAVVTVRNAHGEDVTALVEVILRPGTLTVTREPDPTEMGRFSSPLVGTYYLRMMSYGDFNGHDWLDAEPYPYAERVVCLPSRVLRILGMDTVQLTFTNMGRYLFPYYVSEDSSTKPTTDTAMDDIPDWRYWVDTTLYDGELSWLAGYLAMPEAYRAALLGTSYADEVKYRSFVYGQYLALDEETAAYMQKLIEKAGLDAEDLQIATRVAEFIRSSADYNAGYDPALDREDNVAIAFLDTYREGTDRHFATAATLLYRALGIPARYVTGYRESVYTTNDSVEIENAYSWVEVYIDALGWVQVDVTGEQKPVEDDRPVLELEPAFVYKLYDGTPLSARNQLTMTPSLEALLKQGYTYQVSVLGSLTEIGMSESTIMSFTLYDPVGRDVTATYQLQKKTGLMRVVGEETVIVMLYQLEKTYDGAELTYGDGDFELLSIPSDTQVTIHLNISIQEVGMLTLNTINHDPQTYISLYSVMQGEVDVTESHPILCVLSGMDSGYDSPDDGGVSPVMSTAAEPVAIIKPRAIELTAASAIRMDDGTPLTAPGVELTRGTLVSGQTLIAAAVGTCTGPGSVENKVGNVLILDANGRDVTAFYSITCVSGTLTLVGEDEY